MDKHKQLPRLKDKKSEGKSKLAQFVVKSLLLSEMRTS